MAFVWSWQFYWKQKHSLLQEKTAQLQVKNKNLIQIKSGEKN